MITIFEKFTTKNIRTDENGRVVRVPMPKLDIVGEDFWKMIRVVDWKSIISSYKRNNEIIIKGGKGVDYMLLLEEAKKRLYLKYEYNEVVKFKDDYDKIFFQLYDFFNIWKDKKYRDESPGDDGYSDILSSIIGRGKTFIKKCINDVEIVYNMSKNTDYMENFRYILSANKREYDEIRSKYDPFYANITKYNL